MLKTPNKPSKIVVILGPTATGKSDIAVAIARRFKGEVISADSRQVYKGMDIGTGKVSRDARTAHLEPRTYFHQGIPHHLLDVAPPARAFTAANYKTLGEKAIEAIIKNNHLPIICGGTGFYIDALLSENSLPPVPPNATLRKKLEKLSTKELFTHLKKLDLRRAKAIDKHNPHQLIRSIEIATALGKVPPIVRTPSPYAVLKIGIMLPPELLKSRIHIRLIKRIKAGMIAEVKKLKRNGLSSKRLYDLGLEYRYINLYLEGVLTKNEMVDQLERAIWQYARRQKTWFKRDKTIRWVQNEKQALALVKTF